MKPERLAELIVAEIGEKQFDAIFNAAGDIKLDDCRSAREQSFVERFYGALCDISARERAERRELAEVLQRMSSKL